MAFRFFVAFGEFTEGMIQALSESCEHRAKETSDPAFSQYGQALDPATTRTTTTLDRLSARGRADQMGFPLPPVRGMTRTISEAAQLRKDAKEIEDEMYTAEERDNVFRRGGNTWTDE